MDFFISLGTDRNRGGTWASYRNLGNCTCERARRPPILAHREEKEVFQMVSSVNLRTCLVGIRQRKRESPACAENFGIQVGKHTHTQHHNRGAQHKRPQSSPISWGFRYRQCFGFQLRDSHPSPQVQRGTPLSVFSLPSWKVLVNCKPTWFLKARDCLGSLR